MSDKDKKGSAFPGAGKSEEDDLLAEFDAWDKNFDALFMDEESTAASRSFATGQPARPPAAAEPSNEPAGDLFSDAPAVDLDEIGDEFDKELDFLEQQPQALGDLLGPPPLPPPLEESDDSGDAGTAGESGDAAVRFDSDDDSDDGVLTSAPRQDRREEPAPFQAESPGASERITRELETDDEVLSAAIEEARVGMGTSDPRAQQRARAEKLRKRMPTIVRRDELERRRRERDGTAPGTGAAPMPASMTAADDNDFGAEATRIAPIHQLESLAESAAGDLFDDEFDLPEIRVEVDDEFYDDIEIGDSDTAAQTSDAPVEPVSSGRRVSPHLVRRGAPRPETTPPVAAESGPDRPAAAEAASTAGLSVTDPLAGGLNSSRAVDPEITLDMRVSDVDLLAGLGDAIAEPVAAPVAPAGSPAAVPGEDPHASPGELNQGAGAEAETRVGWPPGEVFPGHMEMEAVATSQGVETEFELISELPADTSGDVALAQPAPGPGIEPALGQPGIEPALGQPGIEPALAPVAEFEFEFEVEPGSEPHGLSAEGAEPVVAPAAPAAPAAEPSDTIEAAVSAALDDVDVAPDLPPPVLRAVLPGVDSGTEIDLQALPEQLEQPVESTVLRSERLAEELALCEREVEVVDDLGRLVGLHLEAGRLAEKLGDLDLARTHYEEAVQNDPELTSALRALRRIERTTRNWNEAVNYLDAEIEQAGEAERHALRAHRVDMYMAAGEQDLARVAAGEILDEDPRDVRALLANLELAFVDGRDQEFIDALTRLTDVLEAPGMKSCLHLLRGRALERPISRQPGQPAAAMEAYDAAIAGGSLLAVMSLARVARHSGDTKTAIQALSRLQATDLAARDPRYAVAMQWRRARWAAAEKMTSSCHSAIVRAAELAGGDGAASSTDAVLWAELAAIELSQNNDEVAAQALLHLAETAASTAEQASAYARAGECLTRLDRDAEAAEMLERAAALDPTDPRITAALEQALLKKGEVEALIDLDRRAAHADPASAVFERVRAATRLAEMGRFDEAIGELQAGLEYSDSPVLGDTLIDFLAAAGRTEEMVAVLQNQADTASEYRDPERALVRAAQAAENHAYELDARWRALAEQASEAEAAGGETGRETADVEAEIAAVVALRERAILVALDLWNRVIEASAGGAGPEAHTSAVRMAAMLGHTDIIEDALARAQAAARERFYAITLALHRANLLLAPAQGEPDPIRAEEIIREAGSLASQDPRPTIRFIQLAAAGDRLLDVAMALEERAATEATGARADGLRFRAAAILLTLVDEPAQAAELLRLVTETRPAFQAARDLLAQALRRMGEPALVTGAASADTSERFERLVRDAESVHFQAGDPARAIPVYQKALALRPGDPLAKDGLIRAAEATGDALILAELALQDLELAQELGDSSIKADIYEELARIDSTIRGDQDSALLSFQAAVKAEPGRGSAVRALERAYLQNQRWDDLVELRPGQVATTADPGYQAALLLDHARLGWKIGRPGAAVAPDYQAIFAMDPLHRQALFHLESQAREAGASADLAALQAAVAEYFAGDGRARAAFLTRAGETLSELGDLPAALSRFKDADAAAGGYAAALFGWRHAAMAGEMWTEVAEAALREAEVSADDEDKAALFHLAGVAFMDEAGENERAVAALLRVLDLGDVGQSDSPGHDDAFVRVRILLRAQEKYQDLAQVLAHRLEIETQPAAKARLHRALADLYHNELGEAEGACQHLRAILELVPGDLDAITLLSDITWQQGAWEDAAETLMTRARMETDNQALKEIFSRLGTIYADKKPDPQWAIQAFKRVLSYDANDRDALEHLSRLGMQTKDWKLALGACERLLTLDQDTDTKVAHLHRIGQIYVDGFGDRARAERAYRMALDLSPTSDEALSALIDFFARSGDTRSVRVHLDRAIGVMRHRLVDNPADGEAYRVIARALAARERAGVSGSLATARAAAELAVLFGAGGDKEEALIRRITPGKLAILAGREGDDLLFPPVVSTALRQLFGQLGERIAKHVGMDIRRYGVGRGDRLRDRDAQAMVAAHEVATEMGIEPPVVYVAGKEPDVLAAEPTSPISVIIGSDLAGSKDKTRLRFAMGWAMKLALSWFSVPAHMSADEFGVLMVALLRQFDPEFASPAVDMDAVSTQQQRLRRLIPSGMIQELRPFALGVAGDSFDHAAIWAGIHQAGNRAGYLACGSASTAITLLCELRGYDGVKAGSRDPDIAALLRFIVSEDHVTLRGLMETTSG